MTEDKEIHQLAATILSGMMAARGLENPRPSEKMMSKLVDEATAYTRLVITKSAREKEAVETEARKDKNVEGIHKSLSEILQYIIDQTKGDVIWHGITKPAARGYEPDRVKLAQIGMKAKEAMDKMKGV